MALQILKWLVVSLGVSSIAGFLALYTELLGFPPELLIETVSDKGKFPSESRITIKNCGKLPALDIRYDILECFAETESGILELSLKNRPRLASRLACGEHTEIPILPKVQFDGGAQLIKCSYELALVYHAKLFWLRKRFRKVWRVRLRVFDDGFNWNIEIR